MLSGLARNIAITGVAYALISVVGVVLAPFLIAAYGLAGYGQILLARLFLPSASFGFLDLGLGENATRAISAAGVTGDWINAGRALRLLVVQALSIGFATGVGLALATPFLPQLLSVTPGHEASFRAVLWTTAAVEPILFLALVAEGILKGRDKFRDLRLCEVISAIVYAGLSVAAVLGGFPSHYVAFALIVGLSARTSLAFLLALRALRGTGIRILPWDADTKREIGAWTRTMMFNKMLGTLQNQAAIPLLGLFVGPAAVGAYDAVVRIPRFAKSVFSLLSTTVLPLASRLRADADAGGTARLATVGIVGSVALCCPPAFAAMAYSHSILHYWIGGSVAALWQWQSLMFVATLLNIAISFGGTILLADRAASRALNRLTAVQVALQVGLSLALLRWLSPWSFVVGQVASVIVLLPFQFGVLRRALGLGNDIFQRLVRIMLIAGVVAGLSRLAWPDPSPVALLAIVSCICLVSWIAQPLLALDRDTKHALWSGLDRLVGRIALVFPGIARYWPRPSYSPRDR